LDKERRNIISVSTLKPGNVGNPAIFIFASSLEYGIVQSNEKIKMAQVYI